MEEQVYKGKISFINYEKHFATIDYEKNGKKKSVNCKINVTEEDRKPNRFRLSDEVSFQLKLADRGDKLTAYRVKFLHNTAIDLLIQKAAIENRFSGYLKKVGDQYFIKEWDSYILFPLQLSPWEKPPAATAENEPISFRLTNPEKPNSMAAELFSHNYIPEYREAIHAFQNKKNIKATITRITPHGVYLHLFNGRIQAKLTAVKNASGELKEGDEVNVLIIHLTNTRIVVEQAEK